MGVLKSKPSFFDEALAELVDEKVAWEAARALGAAIHEVCEAVAHAGGDLPYDGVMAAVYAEVLRREGWIDSEVRATEVSFPVPVVQP